MVVSRTGMYKDRFAAGRPLPTTRSEKHGWGHLTGRSGEPRNGPPSRIRGGRASDPHVDCHSTAIRQAELPMLTASALPFRATQIRKCKC